MLIEESIEYYRQLPHFQHIGACFFITFRLYDTLPELEFIQLNKEKQEMIAAITAQKLEKDAEEKALQKANINYLAKFNHALDITTEGKHYLKNPELAQIVLNKLKEYDEKYYYLDAYSIMSNHVHILIDFSAQIPQNKAEFNEDNYVQLSKVMQLIKGGSSRLINQKLSQTGTFWQAENFDTYIRNEKHRETVIKYILNNPIKIGLVTHWEDYLFAGLGERFKDDKRFF